MIADQPQENEFGGEGVRKIEYELVPFEIPSMVKCPQCNSLNTFRQYQHVETKKILPQWVGECVRPICGYNFTAKRHVRNERKLNQTQTNLQT